MSQFRKRLGYVASTFSGAIKGNNSIDEAVGATKVFARIYSKHAIAAAALSVAGAYSLFAGTYALGLHTYSLYPGHHDHQVNSCISELKDIEYIAAYGHLDAAKREYKEIMHWLEKRQDDPQFSILLRQANEKYSCLNQ